jgi:hypothetical protein
MARVRSGSILAWGWTASFVAVHAPAVEARESPAASRRIVQEETRAEPARALDDAALRAAFLDLVGRPPFEDERARWLGRGRHELVDALTSTEAFWQHWLDEQLYYFLLIDNFRPESERVLAIPRDLAAEKLDVREAIHRIALSPSFDQRNPGADTFVTVVMEQLDGLRVQKNARELEVGKAVYDGKPGTFLGKSGASQSDVVRIAVEHKAFSETLVEREHRRLVRAEPDRQALAEWVRRFHRDPRAYPGLVREWILSPAWDARVASRTDAPNRLFVRALFVDLLGRLPSDEEARRLRTALDGLADPRPLRAVVARLLIDSGSVKLPEKRAVEDPTRWVADLFRRLLGREAAQDELAAFVGAFHDPACQPATVLYAIVTHPDYQCY